MAQQTDWTGFYLGVTGGLAYSEAPISFVYDGASGPDAVNVYASGALLGVTGGYNFQFDSYVIGLEADGSLSALDGQRTLDGDDFATRLDYLLTLRGRLGFTSGNMLFYGTAGMAGGDVGMTTDVDDYPAMSSSFRAGVVAGAGVEIALNDNASIKTEGLVYDLAPLSAVPDSGKYEADYEPSGVVVRSGVNFRF